MISCFDGEYGFLSNFCYAKVQYKGLAYRNSEAAYQSMKSNDMDVRKKFCNMSGSEAKAKGRNIIIRTDWIEVRDSIMYEIVKAKFIQNPNLGQMLLNTGNEELIEGNYWHDCHFGSCTCAKCFHKEKENILGKILMRVRDELRSAPNEKRLN